MKKVILSFLTISFLATGYAGAEEYQRLERPNFDMPRLEYRQLNKLNTYRVQRTFNLSDMTNAELREHVEGAVLRERLSGVGLGLDFALQNCADIKNSEENNLSEETKLSEDKLIEICGLLSEAVSKLTPVGP